MIQALPDAQKLSPLSLPRLTQAQAPLTQAIAVVNEFGQPQMLDIPAERALTVYVDKRELVTLMTLGAQPEWLVLGYLLNQRLIRSAHEVESITVDWEVGAAAVKTHHGIANLAEKTAKRVVTTGCGQGTVFGDAMTQLDTVQLPDVRSARITSHFADIDGGAIGAVVDSYGMIALSVDRGSAAEALRLGAGDAVLVFAGNSEAQTSVVTLRSGK